MTKAVSTCWMGTKYNGMSLTSSYLLLSWVWALGWFVGTLGAEVAIDTTAGSIFSPIVTATCKAGQMTIKVETLSNFVGVVQSRDIKIPRCFGYGENSKVTFLRVNMLAEKEDQNYCGVFMHKESDEYSIAIAIRVHKTLQTAKDKFYMITCGKAGFQNTRNETSVVNLELMDSVHDKAVDQVTYGRPYRIRAHFSRPDGTLSPSPSMRRMKQIVCPYDRLFRIRCLHFSN
ncbi:uncharacterized protein LOC131890504 [Tigriopus californicus]|uniref:uncharacterized protein LOC131890504 n=1 Tax=Tigriopus californicus TaxID=6832 RepID=UPI0027D9CF32|nr:uncharacterized protein LOC131890504 [Tigriopus californicus]